VRLFTDAKGAPAQPIVDIVSFELLEIGGAEIGGAKYEPERFNLEQSVSTAQ